MRHYLAVLFALAVFAIPWLAFTYPDAASQLASVIVAHNPKSVSDIQSRGTVLTANLVKKVRILIVPGHEPDYGGAEFGTLKERDMNVELAEDLGKFLKGNPRYEAFITRDTTDWNPTFSDYFKNAHNSILAWSQNHKDEIMNLTAVGKFKPVTPLVYHNYAVGDVATRLYGIDKWVNENDIDIVIHIHFNDNPRKRASLAGEHSGFAIYVPEKQYSNSTTTKALADKIFARLSKYNAVSDLPGEDTGIIEEQDLIAIGRYNSVNAASMLVEYGYIYEPQFEDKEVRSVALNDLAYETYLGLQDFFVSSGGNPEALSTDSTVLPYNWTAAIGGKTPPSPDTFALQTALMYEGIYPPEGKDKNDCPRTGRLGPCTKISLGDFQNRNGITGEDGIVGKKTLEALNRKFGVQAI